MASLDPIANVPETRAAEPTRVSAVAADDGPVAAAADKLRAEREAQRASELLPDRLENHSFRWWYRAHRFPREKARSPGVRWPCPRHTL